MNSPVESPLAQALRARLLDRPPHIPRKPEPHVWASEGLTCTRAIAFRLAADPNKSRRGEKSLSTLVAFEVGNCLHKSVQDALTFGWDAKIEVEWDLGEVTGKADAVYADDAGALIVTEIKSMSEWAFKRAQKNGPDPAHVMQASLGAKALGAPRVHIAYVNKAARPGEQAMIDWIQPVDWDAVALELERLGYVMASLRSGMIPEAIYEGVVIESPLKNWPCKFCDFMGECRVFGGESAPIPLHWLPNLRWPVDVAVIGTEGSSGA